MSDEKTRWPFGGFFLKLSDEKNGTHEYEEYLRNCKENPLTEEEQREWTESARAVIAELEQLNTEPEPTRQAAEAEGISSLQTPEPAELQEGCCTGQEAEVDVVPAEAIVPLGQIGGDAPAEKERWPYASELIGDAFRHWENGRVLLDMGTGRGKNEFIIKRLASWCVDEMLTNGIIGRVLYLCPLNTLHTEKLQRRMEAAIAEADGEPMEIVMTYDMLYESMLEVQTYQHIETKYRNDPASLEKYLAPFKYIVADECHYFTDFSSYGINTYLSLEVLQKAEADHVVIYMSATGEETYKLLEETAKTPEDRIFDCTYTAGAAGKLFIHLFEFGKTDLSVISLTTTDIAVLFVGCFVLLLVDVLHEKNLEVRQIIGTKNYWVQVVFWTIVVQMIACFGRVASAGGFMYANF